MQEVFAIPIIDETKNSSSNEENKDDNKFINTEQTIEEGCSTTEMRVEDLDSLFSFENMA